MVSSPVWWADMLAGMAATALGFALSSVSRSYRDHRAQELGQVRALEARAEAEESAWRAKVLDRLDTMATNQQTFSDRLLVVETKMTERGIDNDTRGSAA